MTLATLTPVSISNDDFTTMLDFARCIYRLKHCPAYIQKIEPKLPQAAHIQAAYPSVLMGYDFHLTDDGPKLIEINNNAGGLFDVEDNWIAQDARLEKASTLCDRLRSMFDFPWHHLVIMDEAIQTQYMYPEMKAYAALLSENKDKKVSLASPEDLVQKADGLYIHGVKVDVIYNRHTDFYLESESMQPIRQAFEQQQVVLNPYPRSYALVGDKNRMVDWWRDAFLNDVCSSKDLKFIHQVVPETHVLGEYDIEQAWVTRKQWVFKPAARHGGKGVLVGKSITKNRFYQLEKDTTVMQKLVPASQIELNGQAYKFDVRLYMHGERLIAMAGRAWKGQITNFREQGSGWTPIQVVG